MAGEFDPAIQRLLADIETVENELLEKKRMVNQLCSYDDRPPLFPNADTGDTPSISAIRTDQFYGQPLATATREYLEMRRASNMGAASVREIFETLMSGGFKFEAKEENAMRGLRQSLTKNSATFHKLPNGTYGLREWYPSIKAPKPENDETKEEAAGNETTPAASNESSDSPTVENEQGESEPE